MRAKIEAERNTEWGINYGYLIGIGGLLLAAVSVYYTRAEYKHETQVQHVEVTTPCPLKATLDHL